MVFKAGRSASITVNSVDLSTFCTQVDLTNGAETGDTTTFGASWKTALATLLSGGCSLQGLYDPTASTGPIAVLTAAITGLTAVPVVFKPGGTATGQESASFSAILTDLQISSAVGGIVAFSCQVQATGAITYAVI